MKVYKLRNKKTKEFKTVGKSKRIWTEPSFCKSPITIHNSNNSYIGSRYDKIKLKDYEIVEFELIEINTREV